MDDKQTEIDANDGRFVIKIFSYILLVVGLAIGLFSLCYDIYEAANGMI